MPSPSKQTTIFEDDIPTRERIENISTKKPSTQMPSSKTTTTTMTDDDVPTWEHIENVSPIKKSARKSSPDEAKLSSSMDNFDDDIPRSYHIENPNNIKPSDLIPVPRPKNYQSPFSKSASGSSSSSRREKSDGSSDSRSS